MNKRKIEIILEDCFGRVQTRVTTKLSCSELMDKILEIGDVEQIFIKKGNKIVRVITLNNKELQE